MGSAPRTVALVKPPTQVARGNHVTLACPPLGLAYLASALRAHGVSVTVIDAVGEAPDAVSPIEGSPSLLRYGLDDAAIVRRIPAGVMLLGVSAMFSEEWPLVRGVIRAIERAHPGVPVVVAAAVGSATR